MDASTISRRILSTRQKTKIMDLRGDECDVPEAMEAAIFLADRFRLKPTLHSMDMDSDGRFSLQPGEVADAAVNDLDYDDFIEMNGAFSLRVVRDAAEAREIGASLRARATETNWLFERWLEQAADDSVTLICVDKPGTSEAGGFVAYRRSATMVVYDDGELELDYTIAPEFLYVSPEARGLRLSTALMRAMIGDAYKDLPQLGRFVNSKAAREKGPLVLNLRVSGEAHSEEGYRFFTSLQENLEEIMEATMSERALSRTRGRGFEPDFSD